MKNLSSRFLRELSHCAILRAKADLYTSQTYDHYILFLGVEGNEMKVFDPGRGSLRIPLWQFSQRCDGFGLIVSDKVINEENLFGAVRRNRLMGCSAVAALLVAIHFARKHRFLKSPKGQPKTIVRRAIAEGLFLCLAASAGGGLYHLWAAEGLLREGSGTKAIQESHFAFFLKKVDREKMEALVEAGTTVFVDARLPGDFQAGHIGKAVNVPVYLEEHEVTEKMEHVPRDSEIFAYCQSSSCPYAVVIAKKLISAGYLNVSVYKGGWRDWSTGGKDE